MKTRRLITTAVAAITIAASAPFAAHAASGPPPTRHASAQPAGKIPTLPRVSATRGMRVEPTSAT